MSETPQREAAPPPSIIPLQRTLVRRVVQVLSAVMLLWFGVYLGLNDRNLGRLITKVVTSQVRGQFAFGYAHYDYWTSLASLILNTPAPVAAGDFELRDPNGDVVMTVRRVEAQMYIGELIRGLVRSAVSAPFGRGVFIEIHVSDARISGGVADVHPILLPRPPGTVVPPPEVPYSEINIVATMSSRKPKPEDAPPSPGHVRIVVDGSGAEVRDLTYRMGFPGWHGEVSGVGGTVTLRFSTDASETRPGLPSFYYEVAPLSAEKGELVLGTTEGAGEFVFPLRNLALRRFGARASRRQDLVFRGQLEAAGATVELDGSLLDTYCDPGIKLQMSFEHGGGLARLIPGELLKEAGQPRGRVRFFGPFSQPPPQTLRGRPAPCLAEPWHSSLFPAEADDRSVVIEGQVANVDALVATIPIHNASSRFQLLQGQLLLPEITGSAIGGEVRAEPMRISFLGDMPWSARVLTVGTDPAQVVALVPPWLRPYVVGKLRGSFRVSGHLLASAHPERVAIDKVDATLDRLARHDPLPHELKLVGNFTYNPEQIGWRGLHIVGESLSLDTERGQVAIANGKLDIPLVDLRGKGATVGRIAQSLGLDASIEELSLRMRLGGRLIRPEISSGEATMTGFDFAGQRLTEATSSFGLHDGTLAMTGLLARGPLGIIRGDGTVRLFFQDLNRRPTDPAISVAATVEQLNLEAWRRLLPVSGLLDGQVSLAGTLQKPTGTLMARVPLLRLQDGRFRDAAIDVSLAPETITLRSLNAALGAGLLSGSGVIHRDLERQIDLSFQPYRLPLAELPGAPSLPFLVDGTLSGLVRVLGPTRPLLPRLDGKLQLDGVTISGRPSVSPLVLPELLVGQPEPEPLFSLLGMAVRTLTLNQGELKFSERADGGTLVKGRLFGAFDIEGLLYLNPLRPRGELSIYFGCPANQVATEEAQSPSLAASGRALACDLMVGKLLPDLRTLGDVSLSTSGVLTLRFGDDPRGLFMAAGGPVASCPLLASRELATPLGLPLAAILRLGRAQLEVHTVDDDGEDQRYRVQNSGDVLVCSDGRSVEMGRVQFLSQRQSGGPVGGAATAGNAVKAAAHPHFDSSGQVTLRGLLSAEDTDLQVIGQLRLELLEDLLRSSFRHTHGEALVDVRLRGKPDDIKLSGQAELKGARLVPHVIESPIDIESGVLEFAPNRATLRRLRAVVDGATTLADGQIEVRNWPQLLLGKVELNLAGDISARLLQWRFAHNLAEARGSLGLRGLHVSGTLTNPEVEGSLVAKELFLNLRRFHELLFSRGTMTFSKAAGGGRIVIGCPTGAASGCEQLVGTVDGDGKLQLNGRIDHNGIGNLTKANWYQALDAVKANLELENVHHTSAGVYNVEMTTPAPGLQLIGNRDEMRLLGNLEVVAGRYMQDFDLADRLLAARRVVEDEPPFWDGDPFLSGLLLGLNVRTRGTFRVYNNIADLRLATNDFTVSGPLDSVAMNGIIRVESGIFFVPGLRSEFEVRGDSKIDFSKGARWPETPFVDVRGSARELDQNDQQRNIELALRGKVKELRVECLSSESMSAADCASFLVLGESTGDVRKSLTSSVSSPSRPLQYGDPAAKLISSQLLTNQVADPLRQKLRLDTVRIQFGVSSFDVQLCKRFGLYLRMCGLAEWGVFGNSGNRYRGFGELQLSDLTVGQVSLERIEHGFSFLDDTINRFKVQAGLRLPLRY